MTPELYLQVVDEQRCKLWLHCLDVTKKNLGKTGARQHRRHIAKVFSQYAKSTYDEPKTDEEAKNAYKRYIVSTTEFIAKMTSCKSFEEFINL